MTPQSSVNFPKIDLKLPLKVQKQYKKWVLKAVLTLYNSRYSYLFEDGKKWGLSYIKQDHEGPGPAQSEGNYL